jgi:regulatory Fis family protein
MRSRATAEPTEEDLEAARRPRPTCRFHIATHRLFISHKWARSAEYARLVAMLDAAAARDRSWRWKNLSVPADEPIMTAVEAGQYETYTAHIRDRLRTVHAILFIGTDGWLDNAGSVYNELVESNPELRFDIPIVTVVPRGTVLEPGQHAGPSRMAVRWHASAIIAAVRQYAIPASPGELRLSREQQSERAAIVSALRRHGGRPGATARALGTSPASLRRKRMEYLIL